MPSDPRSFMLRTVFVVMAALCGWNAARAATVGPFDCSLGPAYVSTIANSYTTQYATPDAVCAQVATTLGSGYNPVISTPQGCIGKYVSNGNWYSWVVFDACATAPISSTGGGGGGGGSGGITQQGTQANPVYVSLLGPLSPASAASGLQVDGTSVWEAYRWGFGVVLTCAFLGIAVGAGVGVIKKG